MLVARIREAVGEITFLVHKISDGGVSSRQLGNDSY